jgi:uncharacterized protein (TIGR00369 family)
MPAITEEQLAGKKSDFGHSCCLMCGNKNPHSLGLVFKADNSGAVFAEFQGRPELQGYKGFMHGGVISALLDAAMTHCLFHHDIKAMTADLNIRYRKPVPCGELLVLKAWISLSRPPLFRMEADLICNGKLMAKGCAKFIRIRN